MLRLSEDAPEAKRAVALRAGAAHRLPAIYVPTAGRYERKVGTLEHCPALAPHVTLVVEEHQQAEYDLFYPHVRNMVIPAEWRDATPSIGRARAYILEHADEDHIIMLDDDLADARLLAQVGDGRVTTKTLADVPVDERVFALLCLFAAVMEEAYADNPAAVSGAPQSSVGFLKTFPAESRVRYRLNAQDPYFCISFRRDRYWSRVGYELDLSRWGRGVIGEDKALALETLLAGGDLIDVPSIILRAAGPAGEARSTTIPRNAGVYARTAANYLDYPPELFTKPRWNAELGVHDSFNIAFGRFRKDHPERSGVALWTD